MLRPGQRWKCPECGSLNRVYSYSFDVCVQCRYVLRSYTEFLRTLFDPYKNREMEFEVAWPGKKGRRRYKPEKYRGFFQTIRHSPESGYLMEFIVVIKKAKRKRKLLMSFPLTRILPWGPELYNLIYNPEVLLSFVKGKTKLNGEDFPLLTSPEQELVGSFAVG